MATEQNKPDTAAIEKLIPGVEHFKKVFTENRERVDRALIVTRKVTEILPEDETADKFANDLLVKCGNTLDKVKGDRLAATKILDDAKAWAMGPEKELQAEMERIKKMRNERANIIELSRKEQEARIEAEKAKEVYRGKIKSAMKAAIENGVFKKLSELEAALAKMFNEVTPATFAQLENILKGTKPSLKQAFYDDLFQVPYDQNIMPVDEFEDLVGRAKAYDPFKFANINANYIKMATDVITKWSEKLPLRKKELEKIAAGDQKAAEAAKRRAENEMAQRKAQEEAKVKEIEKERVESEQKAALDAEFNAQAQTQDIAAQEGTRQVKVFRLSVETEKDMMKLSTLIGKLVLHVALSEDYKGRGGIFKMTREKEIKRNEHGEAEYVDGVQYWLDQMQHIKYNTLVEGLVPITRVKTIAQEKK